MAPRRFALLWRRVAADAIDLLAGLLLGLLLSKTVIGFFFASRAVVMLRIGATNTIWKGPIPMILGIFGPFVYVLPVAILLVWLSEPLIGTSPGKALLDLTITRRDGGTPSRRQLWRRTLIRTAPCWGMTAALLTGSWVSALVSAVVAVALLGNEALSFCTPIRAAHEAWSATCVAKKEQLGIQ